MDKVNLKALTFDDVLLLPRYSDFIPSEASTETKLTKNISLKIPLISAAMMKAVYSYLIFFHLSKMATGTCCYFLGIGFLYSYSYLTS